MTLQRPTEYVSKSRPHLRKHSDWETLMRIKNGRTTGLGISWLKEGTDSQLEIEAFLHAMNSYPERFARDPQVSFQQHLCSITTQAGLTASHSTR